MSSNVQCARRPRFETEATEETDATEEALLPLPGDPCELDAAVHCGSAATHVFCEAYRLPFMQTRGFCGGEGIPHVGGRRVSKYLPQQYSAAALLMEDG